MGSSSLIASETLSKLLEGSFEVRAVRVQSLVESNRSTFFGARGSEVAVHVIGTYSNHAIVMTDSTKCPLLRVEYREGADGALELVSHEAVKVPVYESATRAEYGSEHARSFVDALLDGDHAAADEHVRRGVSEVRVRLPEEVLASLKEHFAATRMWRRAILVEGAPKYLGAEVRRIEESAPQARYAELSTQDLPAHEVLIRAAFQALILRVEAVVSSVDAASDVLFGNREKRPDVVRKSIEDFEPIAEDLITDLRRVRVLLRESSSSLDSGLNLAQGHDALAVAVCGYEVAGAFIQTLAARLTR